MRIRLKMTEPKMYNIRNNLTEYDLLKSRFDNRGKGYAIKKILYNYDDTGSPYVTLFLRISPDMQEAIVSIECDNGEVYIPFYNPELRHDNLVYEAIVTEYNKIMDGLVRNKILNHERVSYGKNKHQNVD